MPLPSIEQKVRNYADEILIALRPNYGAETAHNLRAHAQVAVEGVLCRIFTVERLADPLPSAEADVLRERAKQRRKWGDNHDDQHVSGDLAAVASYLAYPPDPPVYVGEAEANIPCPEWAVDLAAKHAHREQLVVAGALIVAEIERLDRFAERSKE